MTKQQIITGKAFAYERGCLARESEKPFVPSLDTILLEMLQGTEHKYNMAILNAWIKGFSDTATKIANEAVGI